MTCEIASYVVHTIADVVLVQTRTCVNLAEVCNSAPSAYESIVWKDILKYLKFEKQIIHIPTSGHSM
jgi:hypothetical protein